MNIKDVLETAKQELNRKDLFEKNKKILENLDIEKIFSTSFKWIYKNHINFVNDDRKFFVINPYLKEWENFVSQKSLDKNNEDISNEVNQFFLSFIGGIIIYYHNLYSVFSKNDNLKKFIKILSTDWIYLKEINLYWGQSNSDYIEPNNSEIYFIYWKNDRDFWVWVNNKELKNKKGVVIAVKKDFIRDNIKKITPLLISILWCKINLIKVLKSKDVDEVYTFLKNFIWNDAVAEYNGYTKEVEKITYLKSRVYDKYVTPAISSIAVKWSAFIKVANDFLVTEYKK